MYSVQGIQLNYKQMCTNIILLSEHWQNTITFSASINQKLIVNQ